jgi:hypothetical protein
MPPKRPTTSDILKKYSAKLESQISSDFNSSPIQSSEYQQFRADMIPELSRYEKWAQSLGNIIKINVSQKDKIKIQSDLNTARLNVTASQALTLAIMSFLGIFFATLLIAVSIFLINGSIQLLFGFLGLILALFVFYYTYSMPKRLANIFRLQASSQMVPAILYLVVYMKHTSNLERAVSFASQHLEGPLALDFKKIFYDVEIGKFPTIKQALDSYLEIWRSYAPEFVESFHLIESSLFEPTEARRVLILEKSLSVILDGVYEKMLRFSREIRSPLTNVYMLGIILPTLGLALLPLASTLLGGVLKAHHVFVIFNLIIPFFVFYLVSQALLKRPGGYGESSIIELNPQYQKFKSKKPFFIAFLITFPLLLIGLLPFIFQLPFITSLFGLESDFTLFGLKAFDFISISGSLKGPFSPIAVISSLFITLSISLFFSISYKIKTSSLIKSRENTKALEREFTNSLFQLGNRLGDGTPAEIAFGRVAESTQGQTTQSFFAIVNQNINQQGMSVESAIFDKRRGALTYYPSQLISTSMRILVESVKKGLKVAALSLMSISEYVKNIEKINSRLRDLLAEIVSDMKSNMTFLAPLLSGIVVGLATMISLILNKLQALQTSADATNLTGFSSLSGILSIFDLTTMIPPYFIQLSIGIYIIEVVFILTSALVTVDAGKDSLREKSELSKNLFKGTLLYIVTALISIISLSVLAIVALGNL